MTPILFTKNCDEKIAFLSDAASCVVTEERNGAYTLEMEYPVAGKHFSELAQSLVIKAKPNQVDENQFFYITEISKPHSGFVTISANHISYCLSGYTIKNYSAASLTADAVISALLGIANTKYDVPHNFELVAGGIASTHSVDFKAVSVRAALGGVEGSVLDNFGGEYHFNNFKVSLLQSRGADNGVRIAYGKNLTSMKLTVNTETAYTGIFPYVLDEDGYITIPENDGIIRVTNDSGIEDKILNLDCGSMFPDGVEKSPANLRTIAEQYLEDNDINAVSGSLTVEFVDLSKHKAFDVISTLEAVSLCDTVTVFHPKLNVNVKMKCVKTVYNVLAEKYEKLELGTPRADFSDVISQSTKTAEKAYRKASEGQAQLVAEFNEAIGDATAAITGASGGHVVLYPSQNPQEIRILVDSADVSTSRKYFRWNSAGLGFTEDGGQSFTFALLGSDGKLVINDVTARQISANLIRAGTIESVDGNMLFDLDNSRITNGAASDTKTIIEAGHIDFYYKNNYTGRLGQGADGQITIENTNQYAMLEFFPSSGNFYAHGRVIADGNIDIGQSGRYLRLNDGTNVSRLIGIDSSSAPNLYIGENTPSAAAYNDVIFSSQRYHVFKQNGSVIAYIDSDGFHKGSPY